MTIVLHNSEVTESWGREAHSSANSLIDVSSWTCCAGGAWAEEAAPTVWNGRVHHCTQLLPFLCVLVALLWGVSLSKLLGHSVSAWSSLVMDWALWNWEQKQMTSRLSCERERFCPRDENANKVTSLNYMQKTNSTRFLIISAEKYPLKKSSMKLESK